MSLADFEARYRADADPWGYKTSAYERTKYRATLEACGLGPFTNALELGASIGVFSTLVAPRCGRLTTIDAAPTAVRDARRRLAGLHHVHVIEGTIPEAIPDGPYNLVIASEILYYLTAKELKATLVRLQGTLEGRLVAVHWRPEGPERPLTAREVHQTLRRQPWLEPRGRADTDEYLLDVLERR
ncbi:MAG TPA: SAM-dependent methyltransferase [Solirubrobacteraceae bacterium]